jgi:hypothetical protein
MDRAPVAAMLDIGFVREYGEVLRLICERQCDSLADFAMAEHVRAVLAQRDELTVVAAAPRAKRRRARPSAVPA